MWAIHPSYALSQGATVQQIINRDWSALEVNTGQDIPLTRNSLPVSAISHGQVHADVDSFDKAPKGSTAVIPLKGTMLKYGTLCTYGTEEIAYQMALAGSHRNISSIILDIDSGGGSVDAVAPIVQAINKVKNEYNKPVVASVDLAASAAFWAASACSSIVANNDISAEVGSIGVMMSFMDVAPYYEKEGYKFHTIYAPESSHKNLPFEKALEGKYDLIKSEELSPLAILFQNAVKNNRGGKLKLDVEGLLNGRMFFALNAKDNSLNAKEVGLIDEVGNIDTAVMVAKDLEKSAFVEEYLKS